MNELKLFENEEFSKSAKPTYQIEREYDPTQDVMEGSKDGE